jgi:hypothetical protein
MNGPDARRAASSGLHPIAAAVLTARIRPLGATNCHQQVVEADKMCSTGFEGLSGQTVRNVSSVRSENRPPAPFL